MSPTHTPQLMKRATLTRCEQLSPIGCKRTCRISYLDSILLARCSAQFVRRNRLVSSPQGPISRQKGITTETAWHSELRPDANEVLYWSKMTDPWSVSPWLNAGRTHMRRSNSRGFEDHSRLVIAFEGFGNGNLYSW